MKRAMQQRRIDLGEPKAEGIKGKEDEIEESEDEADWSDDDKYKGLDH